MARNLPTELVILQIAESLQELIKNPDLSKTIAEAYALSEAEKFKADEARAVIIQADNFLADLKKKEDALADIGERISKAELLEGFNEDTLKTIAVRAKELDKQEAALILAENSNEAERMALSKWQDQLEARELAIKDAERNIAAVKADLKQRAETVKAQTVDL